MKLWNRKVLAMLIDSPMRMKEQLFSLHKPVSHKS